jgi:hypothetical protein
MTAKDTTGKRSETMKVLGGIRLSGRDYFLEIRQGLRENGFVDGKILRFKLMQ